ncbi:FK506-binding protein 2 [Golovinomyces cichoracearum]|uniref:peptidylprolyl isomerase n=1 Tax=Golovinomyces cichoracearum TaxID=62708 RepID=A0A420HN84_9PEZI|nr:FK506-binding protein 2 [Golovinomyces cichoracearum]
MRFSSTAFFFLAAVSSVIATTGDKCQVEIVRAVECDRKTRKGDQISLHYRGSLQDGGKQFDTSYDSGEPLSILVGQGSVIKGLDDNIIDMCIHEKRKIIIPPDFGYGSVAVGPIPASSTLIFEIELVGISGVESPKSIVEKSKSDASKATNAVKDAITSKISDAINAAKVLLSDSDSDGQEHNEL